MDLFKQLSVSGLSADSFPTESWCAQTNISRRSEAFFFEGLKYMLVLRPSNFQAVNYQTDSPKKETLDCFYCSPLNFLPQVRSLRLAFQI